MRFFRDPHQFVAVEAPRATTTPASAWGVTGRGDTKLHLFLPLAERAWMVRRSATPCRQGPPWCSPKLVKVLRSGGAWTWTGPCDDGLDVRWTVMSTQNRPSDVFEVGLALPDGGQIGSTRRGPCRTGRWAQFNLGRHRANAGPQLTLVEVEGEVWSGRGARLPLRGPNAAGFSWHFGAGGRSAVTGALPLEQEAGRSVLICTPSSTRNLRREESGTEHRCSATLTEHPH